MLLKKNFVCYILFVWQFEKLKLYTIQVAETKIFYGNDDQVCRLHFLSFERYWFFSFIKRRHK